MLPEPRFPLPRFQSPWLPEPKFKLPTLPTPRLKVGAVSALGVGVATVAFVAPVVIDHGFAGVAGTRGPVAAGADVAASEMSTLRVETPVCTDPAGSSSPTDPDAAARLLDPESEEREFVEVALSRPECEPRSVESACAVGVVATLIPTTAANMPVASKG